MTESQYDDDELPDLGDFSEPDEEESFSFSDSNSENTLISEPDNSSRSFEDVDEDDFSFDDFDEDDGDFSFDNETTMHTEPLDESATEEPEVFSFDHGDDSPESEDSDSFDEDQAPES